MCFVLKICWKLLRNLETVPNCVCPPKKMLTNSRGSPGKCRCLKVKQFQWRNHSIFIGFSSLLSINQATTIYQSNLHKIMFGNKLAIIAMIAFVLVKAIEADRGRCESSSESEECCPCQRRFNPKPMC